MSVAAETMEHQYLTFLLDKDFYALEIAAVQEVQEFQTITKIPQTSKYMLGVINLRDEAIPVVDLRLKFDLPETQKTVNTCIIIVEEEVQGTKSNFGLLVDGVEEVLHIDPENINPPPKLGHRINANFIDGIGKVDDKFVILLNMHKILSIEELHEVSACYSLEENT